MPSGFSLPGQYTILDSLTVFLSKVEPTLFFGNEQGAETPFEKGTQSMGL